MEICPSLFRFIAVPPRSTLLKNATVTSIVSDSFSWDHSFLFLASLILCPINLKSTLASIICVFIPPYK